MAALVAKHYILPNHVRRSAESDKKKFRFFFSCGLWCGGEEMTDHQNEYRLMDFVVVATLVA